MFPNIPKYKIRSFETFPCGKVCKYEEDFPKIFFYSAHSGAVIIPSQTQVNTGPLGKIGSREASQER
jgi:hypothetical protein